MRVITVRMFSDFTHIKGFSSSTPDARLPGSSQINVFFQNIKKKKNTFHYFIRQINDATSATGISHTINAQLSHIKHPQTALMRSNCHSFNRRGIF